MADTRGRDAARFSRRHTARRRCRHDRSRSARQGILRGTPGDRCPRGVHRRRQRTTARQVGAGRQRGQGDEGATALSDLLVLARHLGKRGSRVGHRRRGRGPRRGVHTGSRNPGSRDLDRASDGAAPAEHERSEWHALLRRPAPRAGSGARSLRSPGLDSRGCLRARISPHRSGPGPRPARAAPFARNRPQALGPERVRHRRTGGVRIRLRRHGPNLRGARHPRGYLDFGVRRRAVRDQPAPRAEWPAGSRPLRSDEARGQGRGAQARPGCDLHGEALREGLRQWPARPFQRARQERPQPLRRRGR